MLYIEGMDDRCRVRLRYPSTDPVPLDPETFAKVLLSSLKLTVYLLLLIALVAINRWGSIFLAGYVGCVASRELQTLFTLVRAPRGRM